MKIKIGKSSLLFVAILLITLSNSNFIISIGTVNVLKYMGLFIILISIYKGIHIKKEIKKIIFLLVAMFFFSVGLFLQDMDATKKAELIISMFILASFAIMKSSFMNKPEILIKISNAILIGVLISTVLSIVSGLSLSTGASEGLFINSGFNGGLEHRNYFSYTVFAALICDYLFQKIYQKKTRKGYIFLELLLIVLSNSRSCWILVFLFFVICNFKTIRFSKYSNFIFAILLLFGCILVGIPAYKYLASISETFFFRTNGLNNYLSFFAGDTFHLFFGNAAMAFERTGLGYDHNIRSVIGWNGSTELVILNVLIKNGLLGFVGYFFIFKNQLKVILNKKDNVKIVYLAIWITFVISAFVESYVANINYIYTIVCYLLLANLMNALSNKEQIIYEDNSVLSTTVSHNTRK